LRHWQFRLIGRGYCVLVLINEPASDLIPEAGAPDVELTPAMIAAGVSALIWLNQDLDSAEMIVEKVVSATLAQAGLVVVPCEK